MRYEDSNLNKVIISGVINAITDTNDKYIKFGITTKKYTTKEDKNVYVSLNIARELYNVYQDYFVKGNKIYIKGYLNSYIDKNKGIKSFVTVTDVANNREEILNGRKAPHIREDDDGVLVWNGKKMQGHTSNRRRNKENGRTIKRISIVYNERNEISYEKL